MNVFSKFGTVKVDKMFSFKGSLIFSDPAEAAAALKNSSFISLFDKFLHVSAYDIDSEKTYKAYDYKRRMAKRTTKGIFHFLLKSIFTTVNLMLFK